MDKSHFVESAIACLDNGKRLLEDAEMLEFENPPRSSFVLAIIAQEEFAKAFLLFLVSREVIAWNSLIDRATRDHACKQLLGIVLEHLNPDTDEFLKRIEDCRIKNEEYGKLLDALRETQSTEEQRKIWETIKAIKEAQELLPPIVGDAINILRHEKIGRWESSSWVWEDEPDYDKRAKHVAEGRFDRQKQDALYVRLNRKGEAIRTPLDITTEIAKLARERAERMSGLVEGLLAGYPGAVMDYEKVESAFKALFASFSHQASPKVEEG